MRKGFCKHWEPECGLSREDCGAGLNPRQVTGGDDFGWIVRKPCDLDRATVTCNQYTEPTDQEIADEEKAAEESFIRFKTVLPLVGKIKDRLKNRINPSAKEEAVTGETECPVCGELLLWRWSSYNGHVWMKCKREGCIAFME